MQNNNSVYYVKCLNCSCEYSSKKVLQKCRKCHGLLTVEFDYERLKDKVSITGWLKRIPKVWSYSEALPIQNLSKRVTLMEGGTGLHECKNLKKHLGLNRLNIKNEGENPTGSFKDRGMTVGVSRAVELGKTKVVCASTGNTSSSLSAYSAKAGLECLVLVPHGKVAFGKLAQAIIYGAKILEVEGNFDDALRHVLKITDSFEETYLLNSVNPFRIEGQKTLAFEIWAQLDGEIPDMIIIPVGNAGNIRAVWKGFSELKLLGLSDRLPKMIGVQAEGASPIAQAYLSGAETVKPVREPDTVATAIRIGSPVNWKTALQAVKDSGGLMETVTDNEILETQYLLARLEGIFVEPASASSVAGLKNLIEKSQIDPDETIVCITTGHGLKDPTIIADKHTCLPKPVKVSGNFDEIIKASGLLTN